MWTVFCIAWFIVFCLIGYFTLDWLAEKIVRFEYRKEIAGYIREYSNKINTLVNENDLAGKNKTRLKSVAANLETVLKELEYMINGRY